MMIENVSAGNELAKVLWYYNLLPNVASSTQKIVCPFHKDANPSLLVNLDEGNWHCFGCGKSGNASAFVKYMEEESNDLQALQKYQRILKSSKCSDFKSIMRDSKRKKPKRELYVQAYDYYHGLSKVNWRASKIDEVISARNYMENRGFTKEVLNKCKAKVTYSKNYSIVFPMLDNGKFRGWVCRTTDKNIEKQRKYLYNEGFSRATTLVGNYGTEDYVFVVEGYMDRLKFLQFGYDNVVAILGWKMSSDQMQKLRDKGITRIVSALDNDECGKKGTEFLKKNFPVTRFAYLKGVKDPGEMNQNTFNKMFKRTMEELNNGSARQNQRRSQEIRKQQR